MEPTEEHVREAVEILRSSKDDVVEFARLLAENAELRAAVVEALALTRHPMMAAADRLDCVRDELSAVLTKAPDHAR